MKEPVNYIRKAMQEMMRDNRIGFDESFYLYNRRTQSVEGYARIMNNYTVIYNGNELNEKEVPQLLLSGKYAMMVPELNEHPAVRIRGFEICSHTKNARLPERATENSAGYDFFAASDIEILPHKISVAWTGIKAYMPSDEVLKIYNRSSNAAKKGIMLSNGVGIVDSDYYNNPDNEGDIGFAFLNITEEIVVIRKGEKLGQGIFEQFNTADNDIHGGKRVGGFGSTGK